MAIELDRAVSERKTWKEECERQTEMVRAKQDNLEQCTVMLMLMRSMEETQVEPAAPEPDASAPAAAAAEAQRLALEQRCAKLEAELAALRARLQEAEASETVVAEVRAELDRQRLALKAEGLKLAPLRAEAEERRRANKQMREQLGKSERERQRQRDEFAQELGAMGKKLRLSKSHAESLSRALSDQSRHALGGGGHPTGAAPPPPPPPQHLSDAQGRMGSGFQPSHSRASLFW